jgi:hypothetical protein
VETLSAKDNMRGELGIKTPAADSARTQLLAAAALICGFIGVVAWFNGVDFYHRHFFDAGPIVVAHNVVRIVFVVIFSWLIYAPGAAIAAFMMSADERATLTPPERAVLGFGIGVGIWHVVMLILGLLGLYYRSLIAGLCLVVVVASARHFADVAIATWRSLAVGIAELRQGRATPERIGTILIGAAAMWVLLVRGLYPGGGGDYYTHYFYYYVEVLKNHSLAPNDVWYHYYYSKGSGLAFLGMLLTDPEAPALTTYPLVVCAATAMATFAMRLAPRSSWPLAGVLVYLLFYILALSPGTGEGEFQKDHEEVAALVVLFAWALCMECRALPRPFRVMAATSAIAAAIITQSVGVLLGFFAGLLCAWSIVQRRWGDMWGYALVTAAVASTVLAVFVLSYLQTGLPSDQPFNPMLYFADFSRLDRWGVIPQVIFIAWERDNYQALVMPLDWSVLTHSWKFMRFVTMLWQFMRLDALWPFLAGPVIAAIIVRWTDAFAGSRLVLRPDASAVSFARAATLRLAALLGFLAIIAITMGRTQSVSFARLSTFFIPLIVMFGTAASVWALTWRTGQRRDLLTWQILPIAMLFAVILEWQASLHWTRHVPAETANALRLLSGRFSLAEASTHAPSPYAFGSINPGALAAARQLPSGTPIWSTNVDSYCMVPDCLIESAISFKMSGHLDEILGGDPELAKRLLQEAGLNYFLFMKDYRMIDLLPFSKLFAPETIGRFLGVKWTDGSTFLLTWIGPDTSPIGSDFLDAYSRRRSEPDATRWFRFDELTPLIVTIAPRMRAATGWGAANKLLTWR